MVLPLDAEVAPIGVEYRTDGVFSRHRFVVHAIKLQVDWAIRVWVIDG